MERQLKDNEVLQTGDHLRTPSGTTIIVLNNKIFWVGKTVKAWKLALVGDDVDLYHAVRPNTNSTKVRFGIDLTKTGNWDT